MIWVLSDPQRSEELRSSPSYDGRGASEPSKNSLKEHTKASCVSNSEDPHYQSTTIPPSAYTYVHVGVNYGRRKMPELGFCVGQLGMFWWKPEIDGHCVATSHTWKTVEKKNPFTLGSLCVKEDGPSYSGV